MRRARAMLPVGSADSRYAKGTVAHIVPARQINTAARGFCAVTSPSDDEEISLYKSSKQQRVPFLLESRSHTGG